ncbi:estradiol 17 beta-dehydrogenase [Apiospora hydei]|uniref:Estradiol 17 beta-dehydrogenase n=1 Tax=Apiospora hydei TaxID=1337664 RepID=A0ABR1X8S5_9PEZI
MGMITQFFPQKPTFTDQPLPDLKGKVYIVSGANTGLGKEVARSLYAKNAKVYIFARTESKANQAIADIQKAHPSSSGSLAFIPIDYNDLRAVKPAVDTFLRQETQLHALFNNAGVMAGSADVPKTVQGYEQQLGVNFIATYLFTKLLTPTLVATAKSAPVGTVRVVWVSSLSTEMYAEKNTAFDMDNLDYHVEKPVLYKYGISKAGAWAYAVELAKRHQADGVVSIALNPGNLKSDLFRSQGRAMKIMNSMILYPVPSGAATQLFAAFSPQVTKETSLSGSWVIPFGRVAAIRKDLINATKSAQQGGNDGTCKFWEWTEGQVRQYQ